MGETHPSGSFSPADISLPVFLDSPPFVALEPQFPDQEFPVHNPGGDFSNVNCGPSALSYALKILNPTGKIPETTTDQLSNFLSARGLIYDWGTGVEELTYAARELGYEGSSFFHDWSFDELAAVLQQSKPVVVSLGTNGPGQPGHFVTLTGISADGESIIIYDPATGESILSREEFLTLWGSQGNSGMIPQKNSSIITRDPMLPWMGLFSVISALALTLNQSVDLRKSRVFSTLRKQLANPRRKGIGAGPLPPIEPEVNQVPRYEEKTVYRGIKTVEVEVPVYETRNVKVGLRGIKKKVPQYETRRVQVGVEPVTKQVPIYTTKKVKAGTKLEKREIPVTRYKTVKKLVWKKTTQRVPVYRYIGRKRFVVGYKNQVRWKRVPVTKQVPYKTAKTISVEVPIYKEVKVISGYKPVTEKVPRFEQKQILAGYKTINETIPVFEERQVQVGTEIVTREMPQYKTVRVVAGYDDTPNHQTSSLDVVDQKIKKICEENEKLKELLVGREFEISDVVYLKGGPGAGYGMEKVENSWSDHSGGGGGSTWWMLLFKIVTRSLVWIRDTTNISERLGFKPDAQAIIMYSSSENGWKADEIIVINKGNEPLMIKFINIKNKNSTDSDISYSEVFSHMNINEPKSKKEPIEPGEIRVYPISHIIKLNSNSDKTLLIQLATSSNRSGFLTHEISINKE